MANKKPSAAEEAAIKKDLADEQEGEEPLEGVVATAPIPDKPATKSTKRPASPKSKATKSKAKAK